MSGDRHGQDREAVRAYLSLGANLGRRERTVLRAIRRLHAPDIGQVCAISSLYETEPVGVDGQPPFINAVTEVMTLLSPGDLLQRVKELERRLGRRGGHFAPREIDIDIVSFGAHVLESQQLSLPHPRYQQRAFVLVPLREVAPGFVCPRTGRPVDELIAGLADAQGIHRVSGRAAVRS